MDSGEDMMGRIEQTLGAETTRLVRKQVRATRLPLARGVRQLKRAVSALEKTVAVLSRLGAGRQAERTASSNAVALKRVHASSDKSTGLPT